MKRKTLHEDMISESDFNAQTRRSRTYPEHDSPGGSDILENRETLLGMAFEPDETELDDELEEDLDEEDAD